MKQFTGGITTNDDTIELNLSIEGGAQYTRVYENSVETAINKLNIINDVLLKFSISNQDDIIFYINQIRDLLKHLHIDFLYGNSTYQIEHDAKLIDILLTIVLEKFDKTLVLELLGLNNIITDIEKDLEYKLNEYDLDTPFIDEVDEPHSLTTISRQIRTKFDSLCKKIKKNQSDIQQEYTNFISKINSNLS